jgi:hypothetical protein
MCESQSNNTLKQFYLRQVSLWQTVLLCLTAIITWRIYYPGIMSPDSIDQYEQALTGNFVDWHPPLMAIVLWMVMKLGGDIAVLILIQSLFALFGLRSLLSLSLQFFSDSPASRQIAGSIAFAVTILFLIPFLSPFMFFSVSFWKDAWLAILLLWIISYLLWIFLNLSDFFTNCYRQA